MRRQRAHLRVAEAMERLYGNQIDRHASDVAQHLYQAGMGADPDRTIRFLTLAGDQALEAGAFDEALRLFDEALSIHADDQRLNADLRDRKARALSSLGRGDDAIAEWQTSLTVYESLGDAERIARTASFAARSFVWRGQMGAADELARRALNSLHGGHEADRCRLLAIQAFSAILAGDEYQVAQSRLEEAHQIAERLQVPDLTAMVSQYRTWLHWGYLQHPEAAETGRGVVKQSRALGKQWEVCDLAIPMELSLLYQGRYHDALELGMQVEEVATRAGHLDALWVALFCRTFHHIVTTDRHTTSEAAARRYVQFNEDAGHAFRSFSYFLLGLIHFHAGDWQVAWSDFQDADRHMPGSLWDGWTQSVMLRAQAYAHDRNALEPLRACRSRILAISGEQPIGTWMLIPNIVEALATLGQRELVADCDVAVRKALDKGAVVAINLQLWQMVAGIAAECGQHWDAAQEHYEIALKHAHELPHKIAQPEVRRWYAQMLLDRNAAGDRDKARTMLTEAVEMYQQIGMPRHVEMAKDLMKQL